MFYTLFTIALFAALAIQRSPAAVTIDTPNITQCEAFQITWSGAIDPVNIIIVSAANPCGQPLADLGDHNGTSTTSNTTITPGSVIQLSLLDADDNEAWSGDVILFNLRPWFRRVAHSTVFCCRSLSYLILMLLVLPRAVVQRPTPQQLLPQPDLHLPFLQH
ncbi:hypothetical protein L208DRAFT_15391 [Tricholoma matsutake]|nr:hypothetical protein L208DRAFT_15391 [Tricholoma matsutake 945]